MNKYSYLAKQEFLPLAELIAVLAEYKVIREDVDYGNYGFQYKGVLAGYTSLFVEYRECFCTRQTVEETDENKILVDVESFVAWADEKQIPMPNEFLELIGKGDPKIRLKSSTVDKLIIQGIAKVVWHYNPSLTKEEVKNTKFVQVFGCGKQYTDKKVLEWLTPADPRDPAKKTGPKKKYS